MLYYTDVYNKPVQEYWHNMKFWWPHDEALIAMTLAYKLTGEERYAIRHDMVRNWAFSHFQDVQHGDWFGYLNKDGSRANTPQGKPLEILLPPSPRHVVLRPLLRRHLRRRQAFFPSGGHSISMERPLFMPSIPKFRGFRIKQSIRFSTLNAG